MAIYTSLNDFTPPQNGTVVTVGNFDGVHLGHLAILRHARKIADTESMPLVVLTFEPAPIRLLRPDIAPRILTPLEIKTPLLEQARIDHLLIIRSTSEFLALTPEEFAQKILVEHLAARHIVEGQTFSFGRRRTGTTMSLQKMSEQFGFKAHLIPSLTINIENLGSVAVSSTFIRQKISISRFDQAAACLGRYYCLPGRVVPGHGVGRKIGFPTANLQLYHSEQMLPEDGVFAGFARLGDDPEKTFHADHFHPAAISVGRRETFTEQTWQIEAYLLNYPAQAPNLYDRHILLYPLERLRPQKRFLDPQSLARTIEEDCQSVKQILKTKGTLKL